MNPDTSRKAPPMAEVNDVVVELQEEAMRLSRRSIDRGCVDSWIASNLAGRAADLLAHQAARLEEVQREAAEERCKHALTLQALTAAEAEKERLAGTLRNLAREMRHMLATNPKKDGGLYRQRLDEADAVLSPKKEQTDAP